jgi:hypothetical protein
MVIAAALAIDLALGPPVKGDRLIGLSLDPLAGVAQHVSGSNFRTSGVPFAGVDAHRII